MSSSVTISISHSQCGSRSLLAKRCRYLYTLPQSPVGQIPSDSEKPSTVRQSPVRQMPSDPVRHIPSDQHQNQITPRHIRPPVKKQFGNYHTAEELCGKLLCGLVYYCSRAAITPVFIPPQEHHPFLSPATIFTRSRPIPIRPPVVNIACKKTYP